MRQTLPIETGGGQGVSKKWGSCNIAVDLAFVSAGDWMVAYHTLIPDLLQDGIKARSPTPSQAEASSQPTIVGVLSVQAMSNNVLLSTRTIDPNGSRANRNSNDKGKKRPGRNHDSVSFN
eukprot:5243660-Amphidinium_carterae.1